MATKSLEFRSNPERVAQLYGPWFSRLKTLVLNCTADSWGRNITRASITFDAGQVKLAFAKACSPFA
jgi:hypothetical protein